MKYHRLGVLGGMGPAASAEFMLRLTQQTPARIDQDHIPTILWSDPRVPDRSESVRRGTDEPLPLLLEGIRGLKAAGCQNIVIPCNTAHFWFTEMAKEDVYLVHIVESVAAQLRELSVPKQSIGVMGTKGTIELGLYQYHLNKQGWSCKVPTPAEMDQCVQPGIDMVKAGNVKDAYELFLPVIRRLVEQEHVAAVVLGCTEIPLAVKQAWFHDTPIVNSIDSLVQAAIKISINHGY